MSRARDLTGIRIGRLTVIHAESTDKKGRIQWLCACECGNTTTVAAASLCRRFRPTVSCGCLNRERSRENAKHSMAGKPPYLVWRNLRARCGNPKHPQYRHYGGRGISVCSAWADSFEAVWADMGSAYRPGQYLDRVDNAGNYEPGNCRWVSAKVSTENRRNAIRVVVDGETMNLAEAARRHGVDYSLVFRRIKRGVPMARLFDKGRVAK